MDRSSNMGPSRFPATWFFALVLALQVVVMVLPYFALTSGLQQILWPYLANPSVLGLVLIFWLQGLPGIRRTLVKVVPWPIGKTWPMLAVCLLLPLVCALLAIGLMAASGGPVPSLSRDDLASYFYVAIIEKGFIGPGILEEFGWRGFVLPRLQRRYPALVSSIMIGLVWALWHLPFFVHEIPFPWLWYLAIYIPQVIAYSAIFTWVYNTTGGNLLACILFHGAINAEHHLSGWRVLPETMIRTPLLMELPFFCIAVVLLWFVGPTNLSRSDRVVASCDLK